MKGFRHIVKASGAALLAVMMSPGCTPLVLDRAEEYIAAYRQVEGITQTRCIGQTCVEVTFQSPDQILAQEYMRGLITTAPDLETRRAALGQELMFTIKLSGEEHMGAPGRKPASLARESLPGKSMLSTANLHVEMAEREFPCALLHPGNEPGLRPYRLYHALFMTGAPGTSFTLVIDHPVLGILKFQYPENLLQSLPQFQPNIE